MLQSQGFQHTQNGLEILKDPQAQLSYVFDWSEWLPSGDTLKTVKYTVKARRNDPEPINIIDEGIVNSTETYVELAGGQDTKVYIVSCEIETVNGLIDRRSFRINIQQRSA